MSYEYLITKTRSPRASEVSEIGAAFAQKCLDMTYVDTGGVKALDYIGGAVRQMLPQLIEVIDRGIHFAVSQWFRFKTDGDYKLAGRYFNLLNYLTNRREEFWQHWAAG